MLIAMALLLAAVIWGSFLNKNDEFDVIADMLNSYGYSVRGSDIYVVGETRDTSIAALLAGQDLTECVRAGRAAGFSSDTEKIGDIVLMLVELEDKDVITLYLCNTVPELVFVQSITTGEVRALGTDVGQ